MRYQMGRDLFRNHSIKPTFEHCDGLVWKAKCFENQFYMEIIYGKIQVKLLLHNATIYRVHN